MSAGPLLSLALETLVLRRRQGCGAAGPGAVAGKGIYRAWSFHPGQGEMIRPEGYPQAEIRPARQDLGASGLDQCPNQDEIGMEV